MIRKLFGSGHRPPSGPFYRPYRQDAINHIYNLLFCDDPALYRNGRQQGALADVLADDAARETLERIADDLDVESRVRVLAFNRLRAMNVPVPEKRLLGAIIEVPQDNGLDVLAVFEDKRLRYINKSENVAVFEETPPQIAQKANEVLRYARIVVNEIGPANEPRRAATPRASPSSSPTDFTSAKAITTCCFRMPSPRRCSAVRASFW